MESHLRSLIKAFSWRILGSFVTMVISYIVTKQITFSFYIGLFDFLSKIIFYYLHERIWNNLPFGLLKEQVIVRNSEHV
ncbi:MAG: hypothetical protein A3F42_06660 [Gammaproteobacteria bacterium RIFCSPHIGHO2_12_FULL_37_34]|nr:MAG: hypothetical protein A3F42_06660 [Gammaproteobacteria bacterium RIFCSPHIGHO2_12_FULL_37_34]